MGALPPRKYERASERRCMTLHKVYKPMVEYVRAIIQMTVVSAPCHFDPRNADIFIV